MIPTLEGLPVKKSKKAHSPNEVRLKPPDTNPVFLSLKHKFLCSMTGNTSQYKSCCLGLRSIQVTDLKIS